MAEPSALEQNYPTTQPNRSYNDFTQIEQQIANSEDGRNYAELRARIEALEAAMGTVAPGLAQAQDDIDTLEDDKVSKETGKELMPSTLPGVVESQGAQVDGIITNLEGKVDKEDNKELMPDTLPNAVGELSDRVDGHDDDITSLQTDKQDQMQFKVMPTATADWLGLAVQYIGPTTETYKNNYFYQCGYNEETLEYEWQQKDVQPQGEVDLSEFYTKTETNNLLQSKQDILTAGDGIKIQGTTIMQNILDDTISSAQTTWSSRYLESLFHSLAGLSAIEIVDARPAVPVNNTLYYVKAYEEGEEPLYEIWFYQNNTWTKFGTTSIDLTNYYTKAEVDALLANKQATLTEGTGIRIVNNNVEVKIDGTTIKVNSAGNLYVEGGGGGGGKTYYSGPGVTVDNDNNIIQANVDNESIEVTQDKIKVKEVGSEKVLVDDTDPDNKVYLPAKITEIENDIGQNATDIQSLNTNKADKATTLAGYGITDAYTKTETNDLLNNKSSVLTNQTVVTSKSPNACIFNFQTPSASSYSKITETRIINSQLTNPILGSGTIYGFCEVTEVWISSSVEVIQKFNSQDGKYKFIRYGKYTGSAQINAITSLTFTWSSYKAIDYPNTQLISGITYCVKGGTVHVDFSGSLSPSGSGDIGSLAMMPEPCRPSFEVHGIIQNNYGQTSGAVQTLWMGTNGVINCWYAGYNWQNVRGHLVYNLSY